MSSKFELSLSEDYVSDWGVLEGVRELFQNALDQQIVEPSNEMLFEYDKVNKKLKIGNLKSKLQIKTLLLGSSTKKDNKSTIGQFGEGYKVGTLSLIRAGKNVTFYNYGNRQIWKPRLVKSRRYGARVLTFFVDKQMIWNPLPNHDLVIEIENISMEDMHKIESQNLHLKPPVKFYDAQPYGRILLDEDQRGRIYVNGLFVELSEFSYGYDFNPDKIKLDRDRKTIPNFEMRDTASYMWSKVEDAPELPELISNSAEEVSYFIYNSKDNNENISNKMHDNFIEKYGENSIPVSSQDEIEEINKNYPKAKAVYVPYQEKELIESCSKYEIKSEKATPLIERFKDWLDRSNIKDDVLIDEFNLLLKELGN